MSGDPTPEQMKALLTGESPYVLRKIIPLEQLEQPFELQNLSDEEVKEISDKFNSEWYRRVSIRKQKEEDIKKKYELEKDRELNKDVYDLYVKLLRHEDKLVIWNDKPYKIYNIELRDEYRHGKDENRKRIAACLSNCNEYVELRFANEENLVLVDDSITNEDDIRNTINDLKEKIKILQQRCYHNFVVDSGDDDDYGETHYFICTNCGATTSIHFCSRNRDDKSIENKVSFLGEE